jgi:hypothetical protein
MLDATEMKTLAAKKLETYLSSNWVAADFAGVVREVYDTTSNSQNDKQIRDILCKATKSHLPELLKLKAFQNVLLEIAEYSGSLVISGEMTPEPTPPNRKCQYCASVQIYCSSCGHYHD